MAVLNFPNKTPGATYTQNGISYTYDGEKWVASGEGAYVPKGGAAMSGSVTVPERTINLFDLSTGPYWTCGHFVPNQLTPSHIWWTDSSDW